MFEGVRDPVLLSYLRHTSYLRKIRDENPKREHQIRKDSKPDRESHTDSHYFNNLISEMSTLSLEGAVRIMLGIDRPPDMVDP